MKTHIWPIILIILTGVIVYANTFNVPFHFDDKNNIQNPSLRVENISLKQLSETVYGGTLKSRPVSNLSFAMNYFIGGYRVQGYHLVNISIHVFTGVFLYLLLCITLNLQINKKKYYNGLTIALLATLLWITHPLGTQSVTYIVQRMNSMATMFFVLTILLYVVGRNSQTSFERKSFIQSWVWYVSCGISGLLAIGSKEIAATLPVFIFLYEWYFFQDLRWGWLRSKIYWLVGIFCILASTTYVYTGGQVIDRIFNSCGGREFTIMERVLTQFRVVIHYITLVFYPNPTRLALDYDFPVSTSLFSPLTTLYSLIAILVLIGLAILIARRERLLSFCILWFLGNLVIESSVICLEMVFEHRTYLPSMFLLLIFVSLVYRSFKNVVVCSVFLLMITVYWGHWTIERNEVWQTSFNLWSDSVTKNPNKARPHSNLGLALLEAGDLDRAEDELISALEIDQNAWVTHNTLAALFLRQGKKQKAESHYREVLRIRPDFISARVKMGGLLREKGEYEKSIKQFNMGLAKDPDNFLLNKHLGNALLRSGYPDEALPVLEKALLRSEYDAELLLDLGESQSLLGWIDEAIHTYQKIIDKDNKHDSAHYHIAVLLKQKGLEMEALVHYREANRLMKNPVSLKYDFGNLLFRRGELLEAAKTYRDFLTIVPTIVMTYNNLGLVLVSQGRLKEAIEQFQAALKIAPDFQLAADNMGLASERLMLREGKDSNIKNTEEALNFYE